MDQNGSKWIKLDQLDFDEIIIEIYHQIFNLIYFWSDCIRSIHNGSKWIKLDQSWVVSCVSIQVYHVVRLNTCTLHHSVGLLFEIDFQTGFQLNFNILKLHKVRINLVDGKWAKRGFILIYFSHGCDFIS